MNTKNKIINWVDLKKKRNQLTGKKIVLVGGCFDILHYGHLVFLQRAKKHGDLLVIILESDGFMKIRKERNPVHSQQQRAEILASLTMVDIVIKIPLFESDNEYGKLVKFINPRIIAITEGDPKIKIKKIQAEKVGARLVTVTNLIKKLSSLKIFSSLDSV